MIVAPLVHHSTGQGAASINCPKGLSKTCVPGAQSYTSFMCRQNKNIVIIIFK